MSAGNGNKVYTVKKASSTPALKGDWDGTPWNGANTDAITDFAEKSSDHRPETQFKLLHDDENIYIHYRVKDKHIISLAEKNQDQVCKDACVEFFVAPRPGTKGYFNFEVNCGGVVLCYYITELTPEGGIVEKESISEDWLQKLNIYHTLPRMVTEEIKEETVWQIEYKIPVALFEEYIGEKIGKLSGQKWTANFFKCGDNCSHPHWGMWKDCTPPLRFHQPKKFGDLVFE